MKTFLINLVIIVFSLSASAEVIQGVLAKTSDGYFVQHPQTQSWVKVVPIASAVNQDLEKLDDGDFLTGSGTFSLTQLTLNSIEWVGLKKVIGQWLSTQREFYDFVDFTKLRLWVIITDDDGSPVRRRWDLEYSVSPNDGNDWLLYLTNRQKVVLGVMQFDPKNRLTIKYFNANGGILKTITLAPFSLH